MCKLTNSPRITELTAATTKKYVKKYLQFSADIESRKVNSSGFVTLYLRAEGKITVTCVFGIGTVHHKSLIKSIKPGQRVTMIGEFDSIDYNNEIRIGNCLPITRK